MKTRLQLAKNVAVDLLFGRQKEFLGLGDVRVDGVRLRNPQRPVVVRADTPEGIQYSRFKLQQIRRSATGVAVELRADGNNWGRTEYRDEYNQQMVELGHATQPVTDVLILHLAPAKLQLGDRQWSGFQYSFEFRSRERKIHRLWTEATWEIGGTIAGNTVLHQGHTNMPVYQGAKNTLFTTHCLKKLHCYGSPQGSSFQLAPRGGLLQTFDFQYAKPGVLLQFWPRLESISSLVESPPGSELLHIVDEYRFELSRRVQTTPKWVLFSPGALVEHAARNLWQTAYAHVNGLIRARAGVQPSVVAPEIYVTYNKKKLRIKGDRLLVTIAGKEVDSREVPHAIAEFLLPRLAEQGVRRFLTAPMSESDVTTLGMRRKLENGIGGDLHCASVCATHRFLPSEFWGGLKAWRHMYATAHSLGIQVGAWFAPHLSPRAPIYQAHPEYRMLEVNSQPAGGGYGFQSLVTADWNTGIYRWALDDLRRWKNDGGLDFLFVDSWPNLGLSAMNYGTQMRTNFQPLSRFFHDVQKVGIKTITFEGISPFGVTHIGVKDLQGARMEQDGAVAGQNDFGWWIGNEDMALDMCLMVAARGRTASELQRSEFRAMANRAFIEWSNQPGLPDRLPAWWSRLNKIYNQALPNMKSRHLLPDGEGVCWTDGKIQLLWLYCDRVAKLKSQAIVERVEATGPVQLTGTTAKRLRAWQVYRITG